MIKQSQKQYHNYQKNKKVKQLIQLIQNNFDEVQIDELIRLLQIIQFKTTQDKPIHYNQFKQKMNEYVQQNQDQIPLDKTFIDYGLFPNKKVKLNDYNLHNNYGLQPYEVLELNDPFITQGFTRRSSYLDLNKYQNYKINQDDSLDQLCKLDQNYSPKQQIHEFINDQQDDFRECLTDQMDYKEDQKIEITSVKNESDRMKFDKTIDNFRERVQKIRNNRINIKGFTEYDQKKVFDILAEKNLKKNFGIGLIQFIDFQKNTALSNKNSIKFFEYQDIVKFLYQKHNDLRSFKGWYEIWCDNKYGRQIRKLSKQFFGRSFAYSYVLNSRIKNQYRVFYYKKIRKFYEGAIDPRKFNPFRFREDKQESKCH